MIKIPSFSLPWIWMWSHDIFSQGDISKSVPCEFLKDSLMVELFFSCPFSYSTTWKKKDMVGALAYCLDYKNESHTFTLYELSAGKSLGLYAFCCMRVEYTSILLKPLSFFFYYVQTFQTV